jgi:hypothetical protein
MRQFSIRFDMIGSSKSSRDNQDTPDMGTRPHRRKHRSPRQNDFRANARSRGRRQGW